MQIYLDYMSTTPVDPRVVKKMVPYLTKYFGNPASLHGIGLQARAAVENAREQVAELIHADPKGIIWTSGATEANNLAIRGAAHFYQRKGKHIITSSIEHRAVLDCCALLESEGFDVTYLPPNDNGLHDPEQIEAAIRSDTVLVSIMHVNNEIGVIQDIEAIGKICKHKGVIFHVDAAQSLGKTLINFSGWSIDLLSLSAHKYYGPKGIGALVMSQTPKIHLTPLMVGGGQEKGLRSGTLPTHQIVGMGEACGLAKKVMLEEVDRIKALRDKLWQGLQDIPGIILNGDWASRVSSNLNISVPGVSGEMLRQGLFDIAFSSGAACSVAKNMRSHVLIALGRSRSEIEGAMRLSVGRMTTEEEINTTIKRIHYVLSNST